MENNNVESIESERPRSFVQRFYAIPHIGIVIGILAGIAYGAGNFTEKMVTADVNPMEANACTFTFGLLMIAILCALTRCPPVPATGEYFMTGVVAVAQTSLFVCLVNSLSYIPAFNETVLADTSPAFTAIIAFIWFRDKIDLMDVLIILLAITGVILVAQPSFLFYRPEISASSVHDQLVGSLLAISAAISNSIFACSLTKIKNTTVLTLTFYSFLLIIVSSIIMGFSMSVMKGLFTASIILKYLLAAFFYVLNFTLLTKALTLHKPVHIIVTQVCDLPTVLILQMIFLHNFPNTLAYIGASFVVLSIIAIRLKNFIISFCCKIFRGRNDSSEDQIIVNERQNLIHGVQ